MTKNVESPERCSGVWKYLASDSSDHVVVSHTCILLPATFPVGGATSLGFRTARPIKTAILVGHQIFITYSPDR